jgi:hypothetical protein
MSPAAAVRSVVGRWLLRGGKNGKRGMRLAKMLSASETKGKRELLVPLE